MIIEPLGDVDSVFIFATSLQIIHVPPSSCGKYMAAGEEAACLNRRTQFSSIDEGCCTLPS